MNPRGRQAGLVLATAAALFVAGCGTRLSDNAFPELRGAGTGPNGAVPGAGSTANPNVGSSGTVPSGAAGGGSGVASNSSGQGPATGSLPSGSKPLAGGQGNFASDTGVTANSIQVGIIDSQTNAFDPRAFVPMAYGAEAFFDNLDQHGGVHGRLVHVDYCDDQGQGPDNVTCVDRLIKTDHVFALDASAVLSYNGAPDVQSAGVPDIAGQPIDVAYDTYSDLFSFYGSQYPRNNTKPGVNGYDYGGTEVYRYFEERFPSTPKVAAVVFYNQSDSQRFGGSIESGLKAEGYKVYAEEINFALPDYNSAALDMKNNGVQYVYDTLDRGGNESMCRAMDQNQLYVQAKVTTDQNWVASVASDYSDAPHCRNSLYAYSDTVNYDDVANPAVAAFRTAVHRYHFDGPSQLSEWELEGWAAAQWFTDGAATCGADLTRTCLLHYMRSIPSSGYSGRGLLDPGDRDFIPWRSAPPSTVHNCIGIARWQDGANGGSGGWLTQPLVGSDHENGYSCFQVHNIPYPAT
ncbi:MAG TPA: ABC transporter substrate-binding protein [Mycobacteriales bacterium]|nr:ABC transporter substrate-binding protein [Mycobacteriales bacterium]